MSASGDTCDDTRRVDRQLSVSEVTCNNTKQDDGQLPNPGVTCDNTKKYDRQLPISAVTCDKTKPDNSQLPNSEDTSEIAKQDARQLPTSTVTCENTRANVDVASATPKTADPTPEKIGEPSSTLTSRDSRNTSQKRISLRRVRKRWSGLKKRRTSFVVRKRKKERNATKISLNFRRPSAGN